MLKRLLCLAVALCLAAGCALAEVSVGDTVTFGHYPQKAGGKDRTAIQWQVLDINSKNKSALLLSSKILDAQTYYTVYKSVTWEKSSLREWLNGKFLKAAFSAGEKQAILTTKLDNSESPVAGWSGKGGKETKDKVFLLSRTEAEKYLGLLPYSAEGEQSALAARAVPTAYAAHRGVTRSTDYGNTAIWWLRSPGIDDVSASVVGMHGMLTTCSVGGTYVGVRPALWVKLSAIQH